METKKNNFKNYQSEKVAKRLVMIQDQIAIYKKKQVGFKNITEMAEVLSEYITKQEGSSCSSSTILRNDKYKSLIEDYFYSQPGVKKPGEASNLIAELTLSNVERENMRLKQYIASLEKELEGFKRKGTKNEPVFFGKAHLESYYNKNGNGLEGLFVEWIIRSLAEDGQAFIIIPEGFMYRINDTELRKFMLEECIIEGVISLPLNTFFSTNKKTYILCLKKKKENEKVVQSSPVFTYLCSSIGETLDINRFNIDDNDLADAAYEYHSFKGNKEIYKERYLSQKINNPRLKVLDVKYFIDNANKNWNIDNNWSDEEKIALGIKEQEQTMSINEFSDFIGNVIQELFEFKRLIENV